MKRIDNRNLTLIFNKIMKTQRIKLKKDTLINKGTLNTKEAILVTKQISYKLKREDIKGVRLGTYCLQPIANTFKSVKMKFRRRLYMILILKLKLSKSTH